MAKRITVSVQADITFEATAREEQLIEDIHDATLNDDDYEEYDKLMNKLNNILLDKLYTEVEGLNEISILDTNWE